MLRTPQRRRSTAVTALALGAVALLSTSPAHAVRPFVTDDARIVARGQLESEMWTELNRSGRGVFTPAYNVMVGVTFNEWLEIIAGGGVGIDQGEPGLRGGLTVANPVLQPKLLVWRAEEDGTPGLAFVAGVTLPAGRGSLYDDATGCYLIAPLTARLLDDWLMLHANVGATFAAESGAVDARPFWGVGVDFGVVHQDARIIVEAYSGDPFEAHGPPVAGQWGGRWMATDYVNLDLTFGVEPEVDAQRQMTGRANAWGQLGLRLLFDVFTRGGKPGDPMGARGMVASPFRSGPAR